MEEGQEQEQEQEQEVAEKEVLTCSIQSEMFTTVEGMLFNFEHLIKMYGLIPNGSR